MHEALTTTHVVVAIGTAPPGAQKLQDLLQWTLWGLALICVGGIAVAGGTMAFQHARGGGGGEAGARLVWALFGSAVVGAAATLGAYMVGA